MRCQYKGGGYVQCCREADHDGGHRYKCAGKHCPGLSWIASNTRHPTSCDIEFQRPENITEICDRLRISPPSRC